MYTMPFCRAVCSLVRLPVCFHLFQNKLLSSYMLLMYYEDSIVNAHRYRYICTAYSLYRSSLVHMHCPMYYKESGLNILPVHFWARERQHYCSPSIHVTHHINPVYTRLQGEPRENHSRYTIEETYVRRYVRLKYIRSTCTHTYLYVEGLCQQKL